MAKGPTKAELEAAERQWKKALDAHAAQTVGIAIGAGLDLLPNLRPGPHQGGLTVEVQGPDGIWRRYYVRLTEVQA